MTKCLLLKTIWLRTVLASREIERGKLPPSAKLIMVHTGSVASKTGLVSVECLGMSTPEESITSLEGARQMRLQERLRQVDELFRREMRTRGFDSEQADNLALTGPLARLYTERQQLREELESLHEK